MFEILHRRNKGKGDWCDTRSEKVMTTYNESIKVVDGGVNLVAGVDGVGVGSPSDVSFNPKAWEKAIGDPKKKNFYGHGITQDQKNLHGQGTSYDSTPINNEAIIEAQVIARVERTSRFWIAIFMVYGFICYLWSEQLISRKEDNANNFARGHYTIQKDIVDLCEVKVEAADRAIFDIAKVKVRVLDGTSHETLPRISEADLEVSRQRISVFLSTHLAYELLPESGKAGPDENLKDITLKILQNRVATLPITHSTSNNGSYP
ncbi:reverse transcriptase domain, reverse transcriptase zinc-binding domain protein [Tanacetum coccineum]